MSIIHIAGHLGRDADFRQGATEAQDVLNFSVADNSGEKDRDGNPLPPTWYHCSLWGKRAGALAQYLTKGSAVSVCGKHRPREYTGRDGVNRTSQDVRVLEITLQGSRAQNAETAGANNRSPAPSPQPAPQPTPAQISYQQTGAIWGAQQPTYASVKGHTMKSPAPQAAPAQSAPAGVFVPQAAPAPAPQTEAPAPAGFDNFADDDIPF